MNNTNYKLNTITAKLDNLLAKTKLLENGHSYAK